eukprot:scaffold1986_cov144-Skeletonema_menzelii.AAC.4
MFEYHTMAANNNVDSTHKAQLINFVTRHTAHHTPIALVTSGGTSAPLEHNCVRFLDNFSTGTRGAHAVEQFLARGYAVIHLKRTGSVSPFGRLLNDALGCGREGLTLDTFGKLFDVGLTVGDGGLDLDVDDNSLIDRREEGNDDSQKCVDPWLYSTCDQKSSSYIASSSRRRRGELSLNHRLVNSTTLQSTIRTYKHIHQQGLLLTINFETVDDYLQKLQLCSEAISIAGPLGLVFLAAAVSDFYLPKEKRAMHKIQSRDYGIKSQASSSNASSASEEENYSGDSTMQVHSDNTLTLTLYPVPKIIPTLRQEWCPNAFVVGFKLETDQSILRQKSVVAMEKNNVHLVIGNELATRYEKVFILSRGGSYIDLEDDDIVVTNNECDQYVASELPDGYHVSEVTAAHGFDLEYATIEYVVRHHFHYISTDENISSTGLKQKLSPAELVVETTLKAKKNHDERLGAQYRQLQRERLKVRVIDFAWNAAGSVLGMAISYGIGRMLSGRQQQYGA